MIIIVALGESIVAIGVGAAGLPTRCSPARGRAVRDGHHRVPQVAVLRLGHLRVAGQAHRGHRCGEGDARARLVHVPPHAHGLRHRPLRPRPQGNAQPYRRGARDHPGDRPVRGLGAVHGCACCPATPDKRYVGPWSANRSPRARRSDPRVDAGAGAARRLPTVAVVCATLVAYEAIRYRYARSWIRSHRGEFTIEEVSRIASVTGGVPADPSGEQ